MNPVDMTEEAFKDYLAGKIDKEELLKRSALAFKALCEEKTGSIPQSNQGD